MECKIYFASLFKFILQRLDFRSKFILLHFSFQIYFREGAFGVQNLFCFTFQIYFACKTLF
ncbi:MAG: hypothetical protein DRR16_03215 [Candidatus Parabeggiatoa sp. nov. 3]|nr:MAG: hypothetical protein DRR00_05475 [Gammaproteobacteria bacterium]RKZ61486.1 MAG: hypothetical protein DRQ99_20355 [Gammaproteobacteria bacterium]RKZ89137.1 MAG: hypothetical protein DRR16_03215 [Gammaproteobacteria bacterium]